MITVQEAIILALSTIVFWEVIKYIRDKHKQKVLTVTFEVTKEQVITAAYEYAKHLIEHDNESIEILETLIKCNDFFEENNLMYIGMMKYINEARANCPVAKFNQASAKLPPADPMKQGVEL